MQAGESVELTDASILEALMAGFSRNEQPKPAPIRRAVARKSVARCQCGICSQCLDNLKWETIFDQKFADHDYYKPRPVSHCSALN
jgi:hypothetical protein